MGKYRPVSLSESLIERPRWTPLANLMWSSVRYQEWRPFLSVVDASYWNVELAD